MFLPRFAVAQQEPPGFTGGASVSAEPSDTPVVQADAAPAETPAAQPPASTAPNWDAEDNPYRQKYTGLQGNFKQVNGQLKQAQQELDATRLRLAELEGAAQGLSKEEIDQQTKLLKTVEGLLQERQQIMALRDELMPTAKERALADIAKEHGVDPADLAEAESVEVAIGIAKALAKRGRTDKVQQRVTNGTDTAESGGAGVMNDAQFLAAYNRGDNDDHARARKILAKLG